MKRTIRSDPAARARARRGARALTMVELLVALGVLAVAMGSVLSIFVTGSRFGARARERIEAGRVAQAVIDILEQGWEFPATTWHGRDENGDFVAQTIESQDLPSITDPSFIDSSSSGWPPAYVVQSPLPLVWRAEITTPSPPPAGLAGLHILRITVRFDDDGWADFDEIVGAPEEEQTDHLVGVYYALLADR